MCKLKLKKVISNYKYKTIRIYILNEINKFTGLNNKQRNILI